MVYNKKLFHKFSNTKVFIRKLVKCFPFQSLYRETYSNFFGKFQKTLYKLSFFGNFRKKFAY